MTKGDEVLEHETRKIIFNHILEYPGVSFKTLKKVLNLTNGTLRYHLNYLERAERICFNLEKGVRIYFPFNTINIFSEPDVGGVGKHRAIVLTNRQEQLLGIIKKYPGITQKDLVLRSKMNRFTLMNNLKVLIGLELIKKTPNGNNVYYEFITNEQLKYEILKRLVIKLLKKELSEERFLELKRKLELGE